MNRKKLIIWVSYAFYSRFIRGHQLFLGGLPYQIAKHKRKEASLFSYYHLNPVMQKGKSYIKDSGDLINKI